MTVTGTGAELVPAAVGVAAGVILELEKQGVFKRCIAALKKKPRILVLGSSGVGKSQLVRTMKTQLSAAIDRMDRTQTNEYHDVLLNDELFCIVDTPGQLGHSSIRYEAIREAMSKGVAGIINVVCYGYHEGRIDSSSAIAANGQVDPAWLKKCRSLEEDNLREWVNLLNCPAMLAINKADLWWKDRDVVFQHYTDQSSVFASIYKQATVPQPRVCEVCSVVHNYFGKIGHDSHFDDAQRLALHSKFTREFVLMCTAEVPNV